MVHPPFKPCEEKFTVNTAYFIVPVMLSLPTHLIPVEICRALLKEAKHYGCSEKGISTDKEKELWLQLIIRLPKLAKIVAIVDVQYWVWVMLWYTPAILQQCYGTSPEKCWIMFHVCLIFNLRENFSYFFSTDNTNVCHNILLGYSNPESRFLFLWWEIVFF